MLAGIGVQVLWNRDLRLRRFLTLSRVRRRSCSLVALIASDRLRVIVEDLPDGLGPRRVLRRSRHRCRRARLPDSADAGPQPLLAGLIVAELFWLAPFDDLREESRPVPRLRVGCRSSELLKAPSRTRGCSRIDGKLYPNTAGALGLQDIRVLDALYVERYWRYVQTFIQPEVFDRFTGDETDERRRSRTTRCSTRSASERSSRNEIWRTCRGSGSSAGTATRASTRTPTPIRGPGSCTTSTSSQDEDDAFTFLEARARREDGAFIVNAFDPRREAVVEHGGETTDERCARCRTDATACSGDDSRPGDHRALLRQTR